MEAGVISEGVDTPIDDFLPEGIGSDISSPSSVSLTPDDSISTDEDEQDDDDEYNMTSDNESDDDGNVDDDNDNDPVTASKPASLLEESAEGDANMTMSFLSVPEEMQPTTSKPKIKRKYTPRDKGKSSSVSKKRRKKDKGDGEEESNGGDEAEEAGEGKKKRKSKPPHRRRNIKKFLTHGELTADTLTAQQEEEQRRKRLEEQKNAASLNAFAIPPELMEMFDQQPTLEDSQTPISTVTVDVSTASAATEPTPVPMPGGIDEECIVLGSSSEGEDERKKLVQSGTQVHPQKKDVIEISSDEDAVTILSDDDDDDDEREGEESRTGVEEASGMHTNDAMNQPDIFGRVLVNVNRPQDEEEIFLPPQIAKAVKPHQVGGIRFLYDNLVETLKRFRQTNGFGCILAHSMGLGKTLQMISFINVFLRHTEAKTVLCIVPINTILNWVAEFDMWLPERQSNGVSVTAERPNKKKNSGRKSKNATLNEGLHMQDGVETEESNSLLGDGDSRGGIDSPCDGLRTNEDVSCDGTPSSTSPKESNGEESPGDVTYRQFSIFVMNDCYRTTAARHKIITKWYKTGGVLLMGYEMYRLLSSRGASATSSTSSKHMANKKKKKKQTASNKPEIIDVEEEDKNHQMGIGFHKALCRPGPDLVVCDEGHRIKNIHAGISQALKNIRTRRRVVLTGYPLQNNLQEYWCMVDFVRPNFLGTRHEFANLFERPIQNGQCIDSTYKDVQLMRFRAHVLYSLLEGFVQRRGFSVLHSTLPAKEETVLMVRLTPFQRGLYVKFMHCFTEMGAGGWCSANPLKAFSVGCKIWNHPDILCDVLQKRDEMTDLDTDLDLPETSSRCSKKGKKDSSKPGKKAAEKAPTEAKKDEPEVAVGPNMEQSYQEKVNQIISFEWARDIMKNYQPNKLHNGGKMVLLFEILEASIKVGDRLLVFSQSLSTLSLIEKFLADRSMPPLADPPADFDGKWVRNKTYFRLDGSTPAADRERMINQFNAKDNKAVWLFLLSTRAGCLGINLIGANRVIVMDASWNPCHDAQAVCRVYRYGQKKKCHVYRMVTDNTLEKKIYDRQISKKGMSDRVVDELNPEMNLTKKEVETLLEFDADADDTPYEDFSNLAEKFSDPMLSNICNDFSNFLSKAPFVTESLLWDRKDRRLTRAEKRQAKRGYEEEKRLRVSYSRPSYTAFYPKNGNPPVQATHGGNVMQSSFGMPPQYYNPQQTVNVPPIQSTPVPRFHPGFTSGTQQRLADLQQAGVTMQRIVATTDIVLPGVNTQSSGPVIKAGQTVTFIRTQKGLYLRTTDGRILAVRGPGGSQQGKGLQGLSSFGQFTSLASSGDGGSSNTMGNAAQSWGKPLTGAPQSSGVNLSGISSMDACNLPSASAGSVCGSNASSAKLDIVDSNQMNMQELLDKNNITASLSSSISNENFLPKRNFTSSSSSSGNTMNPTHHSGYPQSLQSLNSLALGDNNTQSKMGMQTMPPMASVLPPRNLPVFGDAAPLQSSVGAHHLPTTASILSSSGLLTSVTPANHRLLSQQSAFPNSSLSMSGGTVPLAAIGMLAPPSSKLSAPSPVTTSVTASGVVVQPKSSVNTESHIPLTLNNLLDGDLINAASKSQARNDNGAAEQSAIGNLASRDQN